MNISVITPISAPTPSPRPVAPNGPASHWGTGRTDSGSSESVPAAEIDTTNPVPSSPDRPSIPTRVREEPERVFSRESRSSNAPASVAPSGP